MGYDFAQLEKKWQEKWESTGLFRTSEAPRKKYYLLVMFAYPSGDIHMGHFRNYSIGDVIARHKMMEGYDLLHPFGWDAFGLPAEGAAIKAGVDPEEWTLRNISVSRSTLKRLGISYDWSREVITCLPDYYKWTQWMFLQFFNAGLAYQAKSLANWCPDCKTVLANEQVINGLCWRCSNEVTKKDLVQWFLRITDYADRLLEGLDTLEGWPENIVAMQRNWIGRSEGLQIDFPLKDSPHKVSVFTTRPDTLYGVTFMAMAPEHPLAKELVKGTPQEGAVLEYINKSQLKKEIDRTSTVGEKDGVFSGSYAINPMSGDHIELWIADYVLASYGTGIVMGVPAHDQRDFLFAKKYGIPLKVVIEPPGERLDAATMEEAYVNEGVMTHSGNFSGIPSPDGISAVSLAVEEKGAGMRTINYRLRDWLVSRQRYWGAPIPIIHCDKCGTVPVPEKDLPVLLPRGDIDFVPKGRSPLEDCQDYIRTKCPACGRDARRDPDTLDTFMCSSWYYLRYADPHNESAPFDREKVKTWLPVDLYIGGSEHACGHLIYFRFFNKFLEDKGWVPYDEPTLRLFNHGMVLDEKGDIMSKSKGNVVSPVRLIEESGVDVSRLAMFFASPSDKEVLWSDNFIVGVKRFVTRLYSFFMETGEDLFREEPLPAFDSLDSEAQKLMIATHRLTKKVSEDIERFHFNTAIAAMMEFFPLVEGLQEPDSVKAFAMKRLALLIAPFAPHLGEEFWEHMGNRESIFRSPWPSYDEELLSRDMITIVIQVNGKVRERLVIAQDTGVEEMERAALASVSTLLAGKEPKKVITVKGKLVNIVL
ncbi:MAG: leucine--tRNA ligase [Candidatus Eremiobacteraeota bacterium]|nr:leucine--tRNA ligase [Candidatus Eremiobacteraeota bacterium]